MKFLAGLLFTVLGTVLFSVHGNSQEEGVHKNNDLQVQVRHEGCDIWISFESTTDQENLRYELQWSTDKQNFESLKMFKSVGKSITQMCTYRHRFAAEENYYRLKILNQINLPLSYTNPIYQKIDCPAEDGDIHVFPNPVKVTDDKLYVRLYKTQATVKLSIRSKLSGDKTYYNLPTSNGWNVLRVDISALESGTYFLRDEERGGGKIYKFSR